MMISLSLYLSLCLCLCGRGCQIYTPKLFRLLWPNTKRRKWRCRCRPNVAQRTCSHLSTTAAHQVHRQTATHTHHTRTHRVYCICSCCSSSLSLSPVRLILVLRWWKRSRAQRWSTAISRLVDEQFHPGFLHFILLSIFHHVSWRVSSPSGTSATKSTHTLTATTFILTTVRPRRGLRPRLHWWVPSHTQTCPSSLRN